VSLRGDLIYVFKSTQELCFTQAGLRPVCGAFTPVNSVFKYTQELRFAQASLRPECGAFAPDNSVFNHTQLTQVLRTFANLASPNGRLLICVFKYTQIWRSLRESNSCFSLERAAS
jgi:hypothetical protein